jgi:hypothetical protein
MSGAYELQLGLYNKLAADAGVMALVEAIYDNPPQQADPESNVPFPFITISDSTLQPWDTDTEIGTDATVTVHVWSRASHALEAKQIQGAIYRALHRDTIAVTGYTVIGIDLITQTVERDPDGITRHGVQDFRIVYEEA